MAPITDVLFELYIIIQFHSSFICVNLLPIEQQYSVVAGLRNKNSILLLDSGSQSHWQG